MKRAVITGTGIVSASVITSRKSASLCVKDVRGITFSQELKDSGMRSHVGGNVKLVTTGLIDRKVVRFMSGIRYAFLSMEQAIALMQASLQAYRITRALA